MAILLFLVLLIMTFIVVLVITKQTKEETDLGKRLAGTIAIRFRSCDRHRHSKA